MGSFESHVVRGEILRSERLLLLIIVNFYFRYASAKVGQKGDPFSNVAARKHYATAKVSQNGARFLVDGEADFGEAGLEQW